MEAEKGKSKVTNDEIFKQGYEGLKEVNIEISMPEDDDHGSYGFRVKEQSSSRRRQTNRPCPFILKIYEMLADVELKPLICWSNNGTSFIVNDVHKFAAQVLPRFYRHSNISSFICQLNIYGFKKISWDKCEFRHELFQRGKGQWLKNIRRKSSRKSQTNQGQPQNQQGVIDKRAALRMEMEEMREEQVTMREEILMLQQQLDASKERMENMAKQARNKNVFSKKSKMLKYLLESCFGSSEDEHKDETSEMEGGEGRGKMNRKIADAGAIDFESDSNLRKMLMDEMNMYNVTLEQPDNFLEPEGLPEDPYFWTDYVEKLDHKPIIPAVSPSISDVSP